MKCRSHNRWIFKKSVGTVQWGSIRGIESTERIVIIVDVTTQKKKEMKENNLQSEQNVST